MSRPSERCAGAARTCPRPPAYVTLLEAGATRWAIRHCAEHHSDLLEAVDRIAADLVSIKRIAAAA